jgi:hypothetical protein
MKLLTVLTIHPYIFQQVEDLSMMYRLFKSTGHGQELGKMFRKVSINF